MPVNRGAVFGRSRLPLVVFPLCLMLVQSARAQDSDEPSILHFARVRDREIKFYDMRLESLQMSAAILTDANAFTLDAWGDNRAWLAGNKSSSMDFFGGYLSHREEKANRTPDNKAGYVWDGIYGQYRSLEAEVSFPTRSVTINETYLREIWKYNLPTAGLGYGVAFGKVMLGAHANYNLVRETDRQIDTGKVSYVRRSRNHATGGAIAYRADFASTTLAVGGTVDYVDRGVESGESSLTEGKPASGMNYGVQAIATVRKALTVGVRAANAALRGDRLSDSLKIDSHNDPRELGLRATLVLKALTLGAEFSDHRERPSETRADGHAHTSTSKEQATVGGAAVPLFGKRVLLAAEAGHFIRRSEDLPSTDSPIGFTMSWHQTVYTYGVELLPTRAWTVRFSRRRINSTDVYFSSLPYLTTAHTTSIGAGVRVTPRISLDFGFKHGLWDTRKASPLYTTHRNSGQIQLQFKM